MFFTVASPIPVPDDFVVKNGSKMCASARGSIPVPVSVTESTVYAPGRSFTSLNVIFVGRDKGRSPDNQLASAGHGIARIHDEIQKDLPDLAIVRSNRAKVRTELKTHLDLLADKLVQHSFHFLDDAVQIESRWQYSLLAAECQ